MRQSVVAGLNGRLSALSNLDDPPATTRPVSPSPGSRSRVGTSPAIDEIKTVDQSGLKRRVRLRSVWCDQAFPRMDTPFLTGSPRSSVCPISHGPTSGSVPNSCSRAWPATSRSSTSPSLRSFRGANGNRSSSRSPKMASCAPGSRRFPTGPRSLHTGEARILASLPIFSCGRDGPPATAIPWCRNAR
jgi:hypothetical protein